MPSGHRRSRDKIGTLVVNTAAKEFETSNMTMTQFLGGAQKSWMTGNQGFATAPSPDHPSGNTETGIGGSINAQDQIREDPPGNQQDSTSAQTHVEIDIDIEQVAPSKSPVNVETGTISDEKSKSVEPISATPTPSNDQTRQEATQIIDLEAETEEIQQEQIPTLHQGSAQKEAQMSRLNELAHKYGGIEELEKILRSTQSPSRNESPKSSSPGAVPDPSHAASRKRVQAEEAPLRKRTQPLQISVPGRSTQQISSSLVQNPNSSFPSASGFLPSTTNAQTFVEKISACRNQQGNSNGNNFTEFQRRLILLKDACNQGDYAFLILHQLLCMGPTMAALIHAPVQLGLEHQAGLQILNVLLLNDLISPDDLAWLATFPLPMEQLLKTWPGLNGVYEKVFICLAKLPQAWPNALDSCISRCYPLLVDEMKLILGTDSTVLQLLISRHIFEKLWPDLEDECFSEGYRLCIKNQREVYARASTGSPRTDRAEIMRYNSAFAQEYKDLWNKHQQHILQRQQSQQGNQHPGSRRISISASMAPPQQLPGAVVSAVQDFSVQSNRVQGRQDMQWHGNRAGSASTPATPIRHVQSSIPPTTGLERPIVVPSSPMTTTDFNYTTGISSTTTYSPSTLTASFQSPGFMHYPDARIVHHGQTANAAQTYHISEAPTAHPSVSSVQPARPPLHTNMSTPQHGQSPSLGFVSNVSETTTSSPISFIPNAGSMHVTQHGQASNMAQSFNYSSAQTGYSPASSFQPARPMQQFNGPNLQYGETLDPRNATMTMRPQADSLQPSGSPRHSNAQNPQNVQTFGARNTPETTRQQGDPLQLQSARSGLRPIVRAPTYMQTTESRNSALPTQSHGEARASQSGSYVPFNSSNLPLRRNEAFSEPNDPGSWNPVPQNNRGALGAQTQGEVPLRPVNARPHPQARPSLPVQSSAQIPHGLSAEAPTSQQILPPQGYGLSSTVPPNPALTALHQAQARSPIYASIDATGKLDGKDAFSFVKHLSVMPKRLGATLNHVKWVFEMTKETVNALAQDNESSNNGPPTRTVRKGSQYLRLRCIKGDGDDNLDESDWVVQRNVWPPGVAALLNGKVLEFRRKAHHGDDIPVDVTRYINEGKNILQIVFGNTKDHADNSYTIGLETIEIIDSSTIKQGLAKLDAQESLKRILRPTAVDPEELEVVGATVLLDLTDPHSSQIFNVPIRGKTCRHTQCFDLDIFLQTRRRRLPTYPSMPDHFKCPICGADARPQSLLMDMYFVKLRAELEVVKRLDAKSVILDEHGGWKIKEEVTRKPKP